MHRPWPHTTSAFEPVASPYWRVSRLTPSRISTNDDDDDDDVAMVGAPEVMMISQSQIPAMVQSSAGDKKKRDDFPDYS